MILKNLLKAAGLAGLAVTMAVANSFAQSAPQGVEQGSLWTEAVRRDFYSRDQGSRLIPWRWIAALKQTNGQPFMAASLERYGYLPNDASAPPGLPIGFNVAMQDGVETLGITCAACHTRQIEVEGKRYRIDGGPAIADLYGFWADLDAAVSRVIADRAAFADFSRGVHGASASPDQEAALRAAVQEWFEPFHAITEHGLPKDKPWGPGRLDAVGMIINRVAGLDIGPTSAPIILENIKPADAPVRPPFLWNAWRQDQTQWPGFAENGDKILGLARNLGEVYGVFGAFHPKKDESHLLGFDYLDGNSANFQGLLALEDSIEKLGPPKWPWPIDQALARAGKGIFDRPSTQGGCVGCHGIAQGEARLLNKNTWKTPIQNVGTDTREFGLLFSRRVKTGVLEGGSIPLISEKLKAEDDGVKVLGLAVRGALLQQFIPILVDRNARARWAFTLTMFAPQIEELKGAYKTPDQIIPGAYEARVLEGIWAAAPYLHNGAVPTLADLLKPAKDRSQKFKVGPAYDIVNVGLAKDQTKFDHELATTDCGDNNSGDSRCGHEFGTNLNADEKRALLEYLKTL